VAYSKAKLFQQAKEQIQKNNLFSIEDVVAFMPCAKPTFYKYFPKESNELNDLKELLEHNKIRTKAAIRAKLFKSEKASELLALYRLIATTDEHQRLNQSYVDQNSNDKKQQWPTSISFQVHPTELSNGE